MPNLLPYLAATLVNAVSSAILASIGLEVLGLGPIDAPTLGMTLYWVNFNAAMINGWWWWWTGAHRHHRDGLPGLVLRHRRPGRDRQPPPAAVGVSGDGMGAMDPYATDNRGSDARAVGEEDILHVEGLRVAYDHPAWASCRPWTTCPSPCVANERFGLVGESGSGKSTLALAILRMIKPPGRIQGGSVRLDGAELSALDQEELRSACVRLAGIALVPQGSMNSLNPVMRVRAQIADALADHGVTYWAGRRWRRAITDLLRQRRAAAGGRRPLPA